MKHCDHLDFTVDIYLFIDQSPSSSLSLCLFMVSSLISTSSFHKYMSQGPYMKHEVQGSRRSYSLKNITILNSASSLPLCHQSSLGHIQCTWISVHFSALSKSYSMACSFSLPDIFKSAWFGLHLNCRSIDTRWIHFIINFKCQLSWYFTLKNGD